jgi:broad specificity phosphatase PhoE
VVDIGSGQYAGPHRDGASGIARIYLARHGRTALNAAGALRGRLDPPLDSLGRKQAEGLGLLLGDRGPKIVVSSPLRRAVETAQAVAARVGVDVEIDSRLIDRDYRQWAGQTIEVVNARWGSIDDAPDVEPIAEVRERSRQALADIAQRSQGDVAVVVSHDAVIRQILVTLDTSLGNPDRLEQETGCFNTLECRGQTWTVIRVNEIPVEPSQ